MALLDVKDLKTYFRTDDGIVKAVDGVSFSVEKGQTLGIVGESGSGKSVTCLTIMGLNPKKNTISSGEARFKDEDLLHRSPRRLRQIRGNDIAMIFKDPMTSLNPVHEIVEQGSVDSIFRRPHMPYTWCLLGSQPRLDTDLERLVQIKAQPPSLLNPPHGCRFHPRCPYVMDICKKEDPPLKPVTDDPAHLAACHLDEETKDREAQKLIEGTLAAAS